MGIVYDRSQGHHTIGGGRTRLGENGINSAECRRWFDCSIDSYSNLRICEVCSSMVGQASRREISSELID